MGTTETTFDPKDLKAGMKAYRLHVSQKRKQRDAFDDGGYDEIRDECEVVDWTVASIDGKVRTLRLRSLRGRGTHWVPVENVQLVREG